jgi:hypothetical protein
VEKEEGIRQQFQEKSENKVNDKKIEGRKKEGTKKVQ